MIGRAYIFRHKTPIGLIQRLMASTYRLTLDHLGRIGWKNGLILKPGDYCTLRMEEKNSNQLWLTIQSFESTVRERNEYFGRVIDCLHELLDEFYKGADYKVKILCNCSFCKLLNDHQRRLFSLNERDRDSEEEPVLSSEPVIFCCNSNTDIEINHLVHADLEITEQKLVNDKSETDWGRDQFTLGSAIYKQKHAVVYQCRSKRTKELCGILANLYLLFILLLSCKGLQL